ncbi:MAG TPA: hypothetical protein VNM24_12910 [Burkholderiales bacterium]|jgi:hypothetical protein|nr:hypothetical protein [Burkholderiales bacterium]
MALAPTPMLKFGFKIRTRSGLPVDNLIVHARDQAEAERKIAQMYLHCEILECKTIQAPTKEDSPDLENIISLIARQGDDRK